MKILLINYEYPPLGGGGGIAAANLAIEWAGLGHQVDVVTSQYKTLNKEEHLNNINIYRVPVLFRDDIAKASFLSLLSFPFFSFFKCYALAKKNKYDFINTHFAIPSGITGVIISKIFKIKNILSIHGADIYDPTRSTHKNFILKKIINLILNQAYFVVAQSNNIKELAERYYHLKKEIKIIPLGLSKNLINNNAAINKKFNINNFQLISVNRLVKRKGNNFLIQAMLDVKPNIKLTIIGNGPEKENLNQLINDFKLQDRVNIISDVDDNAKWQYLKKADCFILPSLHEGFSIATLEAMACGLPVIATNFGGQTDFLLENENAILVKPKDSTSLAWAINKLASDEKLLYKFSQNNLAKIKNYSEDIIALKYLNLLKI